MPGFTCDPQLQKLECKLRHFEELEDTVEREREQLAQQRSELVSDRLTFYESVSKVRKMLQEKEAQLNQGHTPTPIPAVQDVLDGKAGAGAAAAV